MSVNRASLVLRKYRIIISLLRVGRLFSSNLRTAAAALARCSLRVVIRIALYGRLVRIDGPPVPLGWRRRAALVVVRRPPARSPYRFHAAMLVRYQSETALRPSRRVPGCGTGTDSPAGPTACDGRRPAFAPGRSPPANL